jgi:hypothetical protein
VVLDRCGVLVMVLLPGCECCDSECSQDACACPDFCAYTVEASFEGLSASSGQCDCNSSFKQTLKTSAAFAYDSLISGWGSPSSKETRLTATANRSSSSAQSAGSTSGTYNRVPTFGELETLGCSASDQATLRCLDGAYTLTRVRDVQVSYKDTRINTISSICIYAIQKVESFSVSASCERMGDRACVLEQSADCRRYLTESGTFPAMTTAWTEISVIGKSSYPTQFAYVEGIANSIAADIDASPLTGTISLQDSCNPLP